MQLSANCRHDAWPQLEGYYEMRQLKFASYCPSLSRIKLNYRQRHDKLRIFNFAIDSKGPGKEYN